MYPPDGFCRKNSVNFQNVNLFRARHRLFSTHSMYSKKKTRICFGTHLQLYIGWKRNCGKETVWDQCSEKIVNFLKMKFITDLLFVKAWEAFDLSLLEKNMSLTHFISSFGNKTVQIRSRENFLSNFDKPLQPTTDKPTNVFTIFKFREYFEKFVRLDCTSLWYVRYSCCNDSRTGCYLLNVWTSLCQVEANKSSENKNTPCSLCHCPYHHSPGFYRFQFSIV